MVCVYRRDKQLLRVDTRFDTLDRLFVMRVLWPDGREQFEKFSGEASFQLRLMEFESQLHDENWSGPIGQTLNWDEELKPSAPAPHRVTHGPPASLQALKTGRRNPAAKRRRPTR